MRLQTLTGVIALGCASVAGAEATVFSASLIDYGNVFGGIPEGLSTTGQFFESALGGNTAAQVFPSLFDLFPEVEFDTYGDISAVGPVTASNPALSGSEFQHASSMIQSDGRSTQGVVQRAVPGGFESGEIVLDIGTFQALFVGRFTYTGELSGQLNIGPLWIDGALQTPGTMGPFSHVVGLGDSITLRTGDTLSLVGQDIDNSSVASLAGFTTTDVYFVLNVPSPGAATVLGVAGLASLRRRR